MLEEQFALIPGFTSYFSFSRRKTGYSGVATFCSSAAATPERAEDGLAVTKGGVGGLNDLEAEFTPEEIKDLDSEGRCVITVHKTDVR